MPLTAFPVPTTTVVSAVDTFLTSANQAAMRTNIGLGSVDNTSDANKPISTAQQTALDLKQNLLLPPAAMGALVIDATSGTVNTKSISVDTTFTMTVPVSGASWVLIQQNTNPTNARTITLPVAHTFFSVGLGAVRTTFTVPASATVVIRFYYDGTTVFMDGDPLTPGDFLPAGGLSPVVLRSSLMTLGSGTGDLGEIVVPDWITAYRVLAGVAAISPSGIRSVSATGTLAALTATLRDASGGGGNAVLGSVNFANLTDADLWQAWSTAGSTSAIYTAQSLFVNVTVDSANAGTARAYATLLPII